MKNKICPKKYNTKDGGNWDKLDSQFWYFMDDWSKQTQENGRTKKDNNRILLLSIFSTVDEPLGIDGVQKTWEKRDKDTCKYQRTFFEE